MLIKRLRLAIVRINGSAGSATVSVRVRPPGGVYEAIRVLELQTGGSLNIEFLGGPKIAAGSDIKFRVQDVSDTNTVCEAAAEFLLVAG